MKKIIILTLFILLYNGTKAQESFTITGKINNDKGDQIEAATIFIDGSQRTVVSNDKGEFKFSAINPGTYQLVVSMLGYSAVMQNVVILDKSATVNFILHEKQIILDEVVIGKKDQRKNFLKTFIKYFMGESENAKESNILNTDVLDFSTEKSVLKAISTDFLIIENRKLGYRIKYLLRMFRYNKATDATIYEGESVFEDMKGSEEEKQIWNENRKLTYEGSLMHYFRALYKNKTQDEGFLTHIIKNFDFPLAIDPNPVYTEQLITRVDSNIINFKYKKRLYIVYDKKKVATLEVSKRNMETIEMDKTGSVLQLDAQIDKRGSYAGYKNILIQGFWGRKRIADQLPLEYDPEP